MSRHVSAKSVLSTLFILGAAIVPIWMTQPYYLHILILVGLFSIASLGVRALLLIGQMSFGQAGFMAIGAYVSAFLVAQFGWNFWLAFPVSGLAAAGMAAMIGYPALRLKGTYFAILTMALGLAIRQILILPREVTGGLSGFPYPIRPPETIPFFGLEIVFDSKVPFYYLVFGLLLLTGVFMWRLDRSRIGVVSKAIRENDVLVSSLGVSVSRYSVIVFAIAALFTGLSGAVFAHYHQYLQPDFFGIWQSVFLVAYVVVGGRESVLGPVLGALLLIGGFELLRVTEQYATIAYGALIIVAQGFLPHGLMSFPRVLKQLALSFAKYLGIPIAIRPEDALPEPESRAAVKAVEP